MKSRVEPRENAFPAYLYAAEGIPEPFGSVETSLFS